MSQTVYILVYSKIVPGTAEGSISLLLEDATTDINEAEKIFKEAPLTQEYFRKELWVRDPSGRRRLLKEQRYGH
jgi:hypothetical protein